MGEMQSYENNFRLRRAWERGKSSLQVEKFPSVSSQPCLIVKSIIAHKVLAALPDFPSALVYEPRFSVSIFIRFSGHKTKERSKKIAL